MKLKISREQAIDLNLCGMDELWEDGLPVPMTEKSEARTELISTIIKHYEAIIPHLKQLFDIHIEYDLSEIAPREVGMSIDELTQEFVQELKAYKKLL